MYLYKSRKVFISHCVKLLFMARINNPEFVGNTKTVKNILLQDKYIYYSNIMYFCIIQNYVNISSRAP